VRINPLLIKTKIFYLYTQ